MPKETSPQPRIKPTRTKVAAKPEDDALASLQLPPDAPGATPIQTTENSEVERRILVFRKIAAPLMSVVPSAFGNDSNDASPNQNAAQFAELIDSTISLNQHLSEVLELDKSGSAARWQAVAATTEIVASYFRATGHVLTAEEATAIVNTLGQATESNLMKNLPAGTPPEDPVSTLSRSLKALAPVASAVARFSFGRDPMTFLADVVRRLTEITGDTVGRLDNSGQSGPGSPLYYAVLEVAGEFYMQSHLAEMDKLLKMDVEERKEYVHANNRTIPVEPIWEGMTLTMSMMEALTAYLPSGTGREAQ